MTKEIVRFDWTKKRLVHPKGNFDTLEGFLSELFHAKKSIPLATSIFIFISLISNPCYSQTVEWIYEVKGETKTIPQYFWVDEDGNGFYNIQKVNPNLPGDLAYGSFMLMLDNDGQYKRTTKINNCNKSIRLLPFGKNKLISSGFNCSGEIMKKDTRLFNYKGETLKTKDVAFPNGFFANVPTDDGFVFFSKPSEKWSYTYISIGKIDEDLNLTYDSVSIAILERKGFGLANNQKDPVLTKNGTWIIPMNYGKINDPNKGIFLKDGIVLGVRGSKISWQYSLGLDNHTIESIDGYKDKTGILLVPKNSYKYSVFLLLDHTGKEVNRFELDTKKKPVRDLILTKNHIIVLSLERVFWYDKTGVLIADFDLKNEGLTNARRMQLLNDGSIIIAGRRNENAAIIKINLEEKNNRERGKKENKEKNDITEVTYSSIDEEIDNAIISATVYPNPTSSFINFEFKMEVEATQTFLIQIFNTSGQLLTTESFNQNSQPIEVESFPAGTYIYKITAHDKRKMLTGQFIKVTR